MATVSSVLSSKANSWLVLAEGACASPGAQRGVKGVGAGTTNNVAIEAAAPLTTGSYCVRLHHDGGTPANFNPAVDLQAEDQGVPVEADFAITVPAGTPDVRITLAAQSSLTSWQVGSVLPTLRQAQTASVGPNDPVITLVRGLRYEWRGQSSTHPLAFVEASPLQAGTAGNCAGAHNQTLFATGGSDTHVEDPGTLETDAEANWTTLASPTRALFTVDATFGAVANVRYRRGIHEDMCGTISFVNP